MGLRGTWGLPGNLQDLRVALHWQPKRWLGLGVGYNRFALDVDATANDFTGALDGVYEGPIIFYNLSF